MRGANRSIITSTGSRGSVLVVDDNITNLKIASEHLQRERFEVLTAQGGESAIERARIGQPDLILLDVQMPPGIDGFETCRRLKADEQTRAIPVIFTTVLTEVEDKLKGFAAGGVDYVPKPFQIEELLARVNTHITIYRLQRNLQIEIRERQMAEARTRQFVADASHELRSPMTVLSGYLDILQMGAKNDPAQTDHIINNMQKEVNRLSRMVIDLLTLTKLDTNGRNNLRVEEVRLADLLARAQDNFRNLAAGRTLELAIEPASAEATVSGDGDQLYQVVSNLLDNALRYTNADDGAIRLSLGQVQAESVPPQVQLQILADTNTNVNVKWVLLKIQDNGCGIEPEKLPFIFDRFYRADRSRTRRTGNAGLGLSISKSIVEAHGGLIAVESQPEVGTTFSIFLRATSYPILY
jgi:two-component system, sensor histidine kinase and response regulator